MEQKKLDRINELARKAKVEELTEEEKLSELSELGVDASFVFDFALISDVYKAWDRDNNDPLLQNLKRQAPRVASNYPKFNKQQIILEGELAHEAIFNVICTMIKL